MSELIDNTQKRKDLLKHMILQLHKGEAPAAVRNQLARLMGGDVCVESVPSVGSTFTLRLPVRYQSPRT